MDKEKILQKGTEYANKYWSVSETPNEHDNAREDFINGALWAVKNCSIPDVSESSLEDKLYNKCLEDMPDITKEEFEEALNTWLQQYTKSKQIENFNPHSR